MAGAKNDSRGTRVAEQRRVSRVRDKCEIAGAGPFDARNPANLDVAVTLELAA